MRTLLILCVMLLMGCEPNFYEIDQVISYRDNIYEVMTVVYHYEYGDYADLSYHELIDCENKACITEARERAENAIQRLKEVQP